MSLEKIGQADPFASILAGTGAHREKHDCWAYPFGNGPLLGVMAATKEAHRIVEFGTALGYSALWFAYGAPKASVDTIDKDPEHVRLAQKNINQAGFGGRIRIHQGSFLEVSDISERLRPSILRWTFAYPRRFSRSQRAVTPRGYSHHHEPSYQRQRKLGLSQGVVRPRMADNADR